MTETIIDAPAQVSRYLDQVQRLADANRNALGFLPATAYPQAAMKGRLWVAVGGNATGRIPDFPEQCVGKDGL